MSSRPNILAIEAVRLKIFHKSKEISGHFSSFFFAAFLFALLLLAPGGSARAADLGGVDVAWDANDDSNTVGYKVYVGLESGTYDQVIDVGAATVARIPQLENQKPYFCAVTAYNAAGLESGFSEELPIMYVKPQPTPGTAGPRLILATGSSSVLSTSPIGDTAGSEPVVTATFPVGVDVAGSYFAWCLLESQPDSPTTCTATLDHGADNATRYGTGENSPTVSLPPGFAWRRLELPDGTLAAFNLSEGSHTLQLRQPLSTGIVSRIVLTSSSDYIPSDLLPPTGEAIAIIHQPQGGSFNSGTDIILEIEAIATGPIQYQWMKDGVALPEEIGPRLQRSAADAEDSGVYSVSLATGGVTQTSDPVTLNILQNPFEITGFTPGPNHSITFQVSRTMGMEIEIQATSDMIEWTQIGSLPATSSEVTVFDPAAEGKASRYYRMKIP